MLQPKNCGIHIRDEPRIRAPRLAIHSRLRRSCFSCKFYCLFNSERGEMDIVFGTVLDVAAIVLRDLSGG